MAVDVAQWEGSNIKCYVSAFSIILIIKIIIYLYKKWSYMNVAHIYHSK